MKLKLDEASRILVDAESASNQRNAELREKAEQFADQQANIDTQLKDFTQSETSDNAVHKFELLMSKLQRLDVASGYLNLLKEVDELRYVTVHVACATSRW